MHQEEYEGEQFISYSMARNYSPIILIGMYAQYRF